ncbi:uncharacterized protein APUU_70840A [Aspergillus puulaauensis]|uniref:Uncharacterized protein n=1 Tax=Aspergillus puulaauensis TaxID=1220207 RepID=A0A7R7XX00_9EURO|nr:uncharacterized protein APUU_70840A [Aspergillus puulaauensis]BCS29270.1 hypothetical protein APUU_70840A [Aspergillus puulaauensis]
MVSIKSALIALAMSTTALAGVSYGGQLNKGFVQIGTAEIVGVRNGGMSEEDSSSWCGHIADAAQEILDQCGEGKDTADGSNEAYGNGDISVSLNYADEK